MFAASVVAQTFFKNDSCTSLRSQEIVQYITDKMKCIIERIKRLEFECKFIRKKGSLDDKKSISSGYCMISHNLNQGWPRFMPPYDLHVFCSPARYKCNVWATKTLTNVKHFRNVQACTGWWSVSCVSRAICCNGDVYGWHSCEWNE